MACDTVHSNFCYPVEFSHSKLVLKSCRRYSLLSFRGNFFAFPDSLHLCLFNFPVCPNEAIPLTGNGTLSSPNYPKDNYRPSSSCTWAITVSADKRIKFAFTNFSLGSCSLECSSETCTSVEVYDGPTESSALLARFCHDSAEEEKVSSGNQMFVKFYGGFTLGPGFEAEYSETTDAPSPTAAKPKTTAPETTVPTTKAKAPTCNYLFFCFYL